MSSRIRNPTRTPNPRCRCRVWRCRREYIARSALGNRRRGQLQRLPSAERPTRRSWPSTRGELRLHLPLQETMMLSATKSYVDGGVLVRVRFSNTQHARYSRFRSVFERYLTISYTIGPHLVVRKRIQSHNYCKPQII